MSKARLAVALVLPPPVGAAVNVLRAAVGDTDIERIPPHITLVPPVNVRDVPAAEAVLRAAAAMTEPFHLRLGPPTTFLPVNPVLYLAVTGDLDALDQLRDRVFVAPLHRPLTLPFVPHVTLDANADPERIEAAVQALADATFEVDIDHVHLLQEGEGRVWSPIAGVRLSAPAVRGRGGWPVVLEVGEELGPEASPVIADAWARFDIESYGEEAGSAPRVPLAVVARRDGEVVGAAEGWTLHERGHLAELMVVPAARGTGVGGHLLTEFEKAAAERGVKHLTLRTDEDGTGLRFYLERGWVHAVRIPEGTYGSPVVQLRRRLG